MTGRQLHSISQSYLPGALKTYFFRTRDTEHPSKSGFRAYFLSWNDICNAFRECLSTRRTGSLQQGRRGAELCTSRPERPNAASEDL